MRKGASRFTLESLHFTSTVFIFSVKHDISQCLDPYYRNILEQGSKMLLSASSNSDTDMVAVITRSEMVAVVTKEKQFSKTDPFNQSKDEPLK